MNVDEKLLKKVASVARLDLSEAEIEEFTPQLAEVLEYLSKLDKVDTEDVRPSFHPIKIPERLRDDGVTSSLSQDDALKNSDNNKDGYFVGPKAI